MKNALWYLGFLSLLSLLYFVNGNTDYLGFLGFVLYFSIHNRNDERLERNIGKSTRNAFLFIVFAGAASCVYFTLTGDIIILAKTSKLLFAGCIIICVFSYYYYNFREEHLWKQKSKNTEKNLK